MFKTLKNNFLQVGHPQVGLLLGDLLDLQEHHL